MPEPDYPRRGLQQWAEPLRHYIDSNDDAIVDEAVDAALDEVPSEVARSLAKDDTPAQAAALAASDAVDAEVDSRRLAEYERGYVSGGGADSPQGGFLGEDGAATELVVNDQGEVLPVVISKWFGRMRAADPRQFAEAIADGYPVEAAGGFAGDNSRLTELVFDAQGNVPGYVLDRWASRMNVAPSAGLPRSPLPIVCCGDSQTGQVFDGTTYPRELATLLGLPASDVLNLGKPGETSVAIAAHSGAVPIIWPEGGTIPTSGFVEFTPAKATAVLRYWKTGTFTIGGVPGLLSSRAADSGAPTATEKLRFTPTTYPAAPVTVPPLTRVLSAESVYRDNKTILMIGRNNSGDTAQVISDTRAMAAYLRTIDGDYLVLSQINGEGRDAINASNRDFFSSRYVDVLGYLASETALVEAGLTPTTADRNAIAAGNIPPSFYADTVHLNGAGLRAQARFIARILPSKGWL